MIDERKLIEDIVAGMSNCNLIQADALRQVMYLIHDHPKIGEWIPCSERMPEEPVPDVFYGLAEIDAYPEYIVMIEGAEKPTFLSYMGNGEWYRDGNFYKVVAWMPLPESYGAWSKEL